MTHRGVHSMKGINFNEAEIFIIAISGRKYPFYILGGKRNFLEYTSQ